MHARCRLFLVLALIVALLTGIWGCGNGGSDPQAVAVVNGHPISLAELEERYDLLLLDEEAAVRVAKLRADYGVVLSELIIHELVRQELESRGLSVGHEELAAAEARIRADYPEGAFEEMLVEEYIDIEAWRRLFKTKLAMDTFLSQVIRPQVKIGYDEAEAYYKKHAAEFYLPPRVTFLLFQGSDRRALNNAVRTRQEGVEIPDLQKSYPDVEIRKVTLREDQLPAKWRASLAALTPGKAGKSLTERGNITRLMLLERLPAKVLEPGQAYPLIERKLVDAKVGAAFDSWLAAQLDAAEIEVNRELLSPGGGGEDAGEALLPAAGQ
jgi:hypothetical protein